ncbi:unnamed protein product [Schistosoma margrebowiei]|uniref:Uncharacterized protein n=1 Tax=Schistosoma margrebowiei TaxID=48269 RepID=A0A183LES7_9TREM|nr:unnamed protein product [Schistosoma margrebowiei]
MVVGGSRQETLDRGFVLLGIRQQGVPVILRELVLSGGFDLVSPRFTNSIKKLYNKNGKYPKSVYTFNIKNWDETGFFNNITEFNYPLL